MAGRYGLLYAHVRAVFRAALPALALLVIDTRRDVQPHDDVARALRLRGGFGVELRQRRRCRGVAMRRGVECLLRTSMSMRAHPKSVQDML